jgi:hypothetical protein
MEIEWNPGGSKLLAIIDGTHDGIITCTVHDMSMKRKRIR